MKLFCFDLTKGSNKYIAAKYCKTAFICYCFFSYSFHLFYIYYVYRVEFMSIVIQFVFPSSIPCSGFEKRSCVDKKKRQKKEKKRKEKGKEKR